MTDVIMANYLKMFSILTDPLTENGEKFLVRSVRKFENFGCGDFILGSKGGGDFEVF